VRSPSNRLIVVSVVALALVFSACSKGGGAGAQPAATVGPSSITDAQVAHESQLFMFLAALNRTPCGQAVAGETEASACNRFSLSNLIQTTFIERYAADHDLAVTDQEVAGIIKNLDTQVGAKTVDASLKKQHLGRDDLNELARSVLLLQKVQKDVTAGSLGEARLRDLYQQQILDFTTVQVDHILVKTKAEAEHVYQEVTKPGATEQDFLDLAKKVSIDPSAAQNSGSLGSAVASTYVPEFGQAAAALAPGEISKPVQTQFGWHVIRMVDKQVTPYAQAKQTLIQNNATVAFNDWMRKEANDQGVDVNPKFGRWDVQSLTVMAITSTDPSATSSPVGASGATGATGGTGATAPTASATP
jgi:PPIC-type PPIASE domain/SurA-like N-terminal domain